MGRFSIMLLALLSLTTTACVDAGPANRLADALVGKPITKSVAVAPETWATLTRFDGLRSAADNTLSKTGGMLSQYHGHGGGGGLGFFGGLLFGAAQLRRAGQLESFTTDLRAFLIGLTQGRTVPCCQLYHATACDVVTAPFRPLAPFARREVSVSCRDVDGNTLDFVVSAGVVVGVRADTLYKTAAATTPERDELDLK